MPDSIKMKQSFHMQFSKYEQGKKNPHFDAKARVDQGIWRGKKRSKNRIYQLHRKPNKAMAEDKNP